MATPLTETSLGSFPLLLKREEFTPSGSHKDRPTRLIARSLRDGGKFRPRGGKKPRFLLSSSGNFGNGFAYHTQDDPIDVVVVTDVFSRAKVAATLGEVIAGIKQPSNHPGTTTFVNPMGMAVEDLAVALTVYRKAVTRGVGQALQPTAA